MIITLVIIVTASSTYHCCYYCLGSKPSHTGSATHSSAEPPIGLRLMATGSLGFRVSGLGFKV